MASAWTLAGGPCGRVLAQPSARPDRARLRARRWRGCDDCIASPARRPGRQRRPCSPPTRAAPSRPSRWRWRSASRTSTCWSSPSRPAWLCTPRPAIGAARCSMACWPTTVAPPQLPRAGIVHRLDKDTSGLMVVAKTLPAMTALVRAIAAREVRREYLALVHGEVAAAPFSIDAPIGRDLVSRVRMAVVAERQAGAHRCRARRLSRRHQRRAVHACTPGARTRSVCTWLRAAIRWWPMRCTVARRHSASSARPCTPRGSGWRIPSRRRTLRFEEPLPPDLAPAWRNVCG